MEMDIRRVTEDFSVTGQISPGDVEKIAAAGFRSIICNRPDGEALDQPDFGQIAKIAAEHGIATCYLPVISGQVTDGDAVEFGNAMEKVAGPVLAYCRTGTRCTVLWSLDQGARGRPVREVLETALNAGYDMTGLAPRIAEAGSRA